MRDVVEFAAPLGLLGRLVERLVLDRYMIRLIGRRNLYIKSVVESALQAEDEDAEDGGLRRGS